MNKLQFATAFNTVVCIVLVLQPHEAEAGCWNYLTGSRCDSETFWKKFGYQSCNDNCKSKGFKRGKCEKGKEKCGSLTRTVNKCQCYK